MSGPVIQTPRGAIFKTPNGSARLIWNPGFQPVWQGRYTGAQHFVDSEVLRGTEPYTPLLTGALVKSGQLGTEIGSGLVQWITPYARRQYYAKRQPGSQTGPLRGPRWFDRWKAADGGATVKKSRRLAGGGVR